MTNLLGMLIVLKNHILQLPAQRGKRFSARVPVTPVVQVMMIVVNLEEYDLD